MQARLPFVTCGQWALLKSWLIVFPLDDFINEVDIAIFDGGHQFLGIPVVLVILIVQSPVV